MSGSPEHDAVEATKEDSILTEAARTSRSGGGTHEHDGGGDARANGGATLRTDKCTIRFGGLVAVNELNMDVREGEIYGLIGPNGAGKTTIFNLLTGVYKPTSGEIHFQGKRIDGLRPYEIASRGVSRTFQNIRLFPSMSVLENVMTA
ncbi:MAG TPA: ATP-binding cassette domain-containing protein, partial [Pyrinomonadaceae bacterium]